MTIELAKNLDEHSKWIEQECQNRLNSYLITVSILMAASAATMQLNVKLSIVFATISLFISAMQILLGRRQNKYLHTVDTKLDTLLFSETSNDEEMISTYKELAIYYTRKLNNDKHFLSPTKLDSFDNLVTNKRLLWLMPLLFFISSIMLLASLLNII